MLGRVLGMAAVIAAASVGLAAIAGRAPADAPVSAATAGDNWTTQKSGRGSGSAVSPGAASGGEVRLDRAGDSHFYADANVDGTAIRMLVDSGASVIALTRADAEAIGIDVDRLPVAGTARTAGGDVPMRRTLLDRVDIDGVEVRHVEAAVIDADIGVSLLGQSYLSRLAAVNIEGDTMTLR